MRSSITFALAVAALAASPTLAKDKKPVDPNKRVCRQSQVTGSIMPGKPVCHSAAEWAAIDVQNQNTLDQMHNGNRGVGGVRSSGSN